MWYDYIGPVEERPDKDKPKLIAMSLREQLAYKIRDYRKTWRMSQSKLASKAGTTQKVISLIEQGRYNPSLDLVDRITAAFGQRIVIHWQPSAQNPPDKAE